MASMALQISQTNTALQGGLQGYLNGTLTPQQNVAFQALMAGLLQGQTAAKAGTNILPEGAAAAGAQTQAQFTLDDLKALTPEALQALIAQMLALKNPAIPLIGDALSGTSTLSGDTQTQDIYAVIDDPDMAAALLGFLNNAQTTQAAATKAATLRQNISGQFVITSEQSFDLATLAKLPTITVPTEGDSFQALKKLAFADLAPFLTKPRTVRIDSHQVAEIAQGPSFLQTSLTVGDIAALAGLAPTLTAPMTDAQIKALVAAQVQSQPAAHIPSNILQAAVIPAKPEIATSPLHTLQSAKAALSNPLWLAGLRTQAAQTPEGDEGKNNPAAGKIKDAALLATQSQAQLQTNQLLQAATKTPAQLLAAGLIPSTTGITPQQIMPSNSASRGFELGGVKTDGLTLDSSPFAMVQGSELGLKIQADGLQTAGFSNSLMASSRAPHLHPSTQLISVALQKAAQQGDVPGEQAFTIQLDPPQLGRLRIIMQIGHDKSVKASLMAERPETLSLLQRDAQALERTLNAAGLEVSGRDGLQFSLGDSGNFDQSKGGQYHGGQGPSQNNGDDNALIQDIKSVMTWFVDPVTGQQHINIMV